MDKLTRYTDTRGTSAPTATFSDVVVKGIAPGGGLFVPEHLPELSLEEVLALSEVPYWQRATTVFERFGVDFDSEKIAALMRRAYGNQWDDARVAPIREIVPGMHVIELWHGPTQAFKDMALQCMPLFFSEAVERKQLAGELSDDYLVLVATSGDTGKAALEGFADRDHTSIAVFYPAGGVSDIQRKQMVTQRGDNVAVFGVRGNFDDCQTAVKQAFSDYQFNGWLHDERSLRLSSANSINWGRLLPQIVYYLSAYAEMVASGGVKAGESIDVCVPTGNFGNILGAYYAKAMGTPIGKLICASNENNVLSDFIATGVYDIAERPFVQTPSPSMDILVSSNLERLLYHLAGPDSVRVWMSELAEQRRFGVGRETFKKLRETFVGDFASNAESLATIRRVYDEVGYLMDPHTSVAWEVAERTRGECPVLIVSTAHWAKFGEDVFKALNDLGHDDPLPDEYRDLTGVELLQHVTEHDPGLQVPPALDCLDGAEVRFEEVVDSGRENVEQAVRRWLARD